MGFFHLIWAYNLGCLFVMLAAKTKNSAASLLQWMQMFTIIPGPQFWIGMHSCATRVAKWLGEIEFLKEREQTRIYLGLCDEQWLW